MSNRKWSGRCKGISFETKKTHTNIYFLLGRKRSKTCIHIPSNIVKKIGVVKLMDFVSKSLDNKTMHAFYRNQFDFEEFIDNKIQNVQLVADPQMAVSV